MIALSLIYSLPIAVIGILILVRYGCNDLRQFISSRLRHDSNNHHNIDKNFDNHDTRQLADEILSKRVTKHASRRLDDPKYEAAMAQYKAWSDEQSASFIVNTWQMKDFRSNAGVSYFPFHDLFLSRNTDDMENQLIDNNNNDKNSSSSSSNNSKITTMHNEDVVMISQLGQFEVYHVHNTGLNESDWKSLHPLTSIEEIKFENNSSNRLESYYFPGGDMRLFQHRGKPYAAFVSGNPYRMNYAELKYIENDKTLYFDIPGKKISVDHEYGAAIPQKNWSPFEHVDASGVGRLLFIQNSNPHRIVHANETVEAANAKYLKGHTICSTQFKLDFWKFGDPRGGTPAILVDTKYGKKYLTFFHSQNRYVLSWLLTYFFGAYLFDPDPPFAITHFSPHPIFPWSWYNEYVSGWAFRAIDYIVFPMGFIVRDGNVLLTAGRNDRQAWTLTMKLDKLIDFLIPTTESNVILNKYDEHMARFESSYQMEHKFKNNSARLH